MLPVLVGYAYAFGHSEVYEESNEYLDSRVILYDTARGCYNAILRHFKDKLDEMTWSDNIEEEISNVDANKLSWDDGWEIAWFGDEFFDNQGVFMKCVFKEADPGTPTEIE